MSAAVDTPADLVDLVGKPLGETPWREVSQPQVNTFGTVTGDEQWIHVDVERAKAGPFGGPIAHGYLTLSLVGPLFAELLVVRRARMVVNYGLDRVRFPAPVPVGGRVRLSATVAEVTEVSGGLQLIADAVIEVQGSPKPACVARPVYRYFV
ncbi:MaoC family dehydratase [Gordonia terrae]|uniref:MaoC family dehydratase n=2 Tax=Gordonia TaxID=2053 RepID=A0A2I1R3X9_9ACTN|nr:MULTISPECIES: MaoC family dehydratase [Gordonia]PKZ63833.1 MaoC family dehydratase [Gordonia terrae]UPW10062.1 MaoC family dehydratase [Gordonia terrae]SDU79350.1 Acyl dehydratase [Gordonia westfalica]